MLDFIGFSDFRKVEESMVKVKRIDPETFPLLKFRKLREPPPERSRVETKNLPLKELDYSSLVSTQKIVDGMMTRELRRSFPEAEIVRQVLKNPAVGDGDAPEIVEAVRQRVRFNLLTKWRGS
jgi:hypothetical protein